MLIHIFALTFYLLLLPPTWIATTTSPSMSWTFHTALNDATRIVWLARPKGLAGPPLPSSHQAEASLRASYTYQLLPLGQQQTRQLRKQRSYIHVPSSRASLITSPHLGHCAHPSRPAMQAPVPSITVPIQRACQRFNSGFRALRVMFFPGPSLRPSSGAVPSSRGKSLRSD